MIFTRARQKPKAFTLFYKLVCIWTPHYATQKVTQSNLSNKIPGLFYNGRHTKLADRTA